jgi:hypothetical protein
MQIEKWELLNLFQELGGIGEGSEFKYDIFDIL